MLDEEEHAKRMEIENKKRKQMANRGAPSTLKLKKVSGLKVFDTVDDSQGNRATETVEEVKVETVSKSKKETKSSNKEESVLPPDTLAMITKTAAWVVENPDKLQLLLEKSKDNETMFFLFDRFSPAGKKYLDEVQRHKAEREVKDVFYGTTPISTSVMTPTLGLGIEQQQRERERERERDRGG